MSRIGFGSTYRNWVARMSKDHGNAGLKAAIGGEFEAFGIIELELLKFYGLLPTHQVIDVGCGSGRLAVRLSEYLTGAYTGVDVVPELVEAASRAVERPDWRFEVVETCRLPAADATTDFVCMFSVVTHLLHEQSYLYFEESVRVLRPGGRLVISFLEFAMDFHWAVFEHTVSNERHGGEHPLNMFIERGAIRAWARRVGLDIVEFRDGDDVFVPLPHALRLDDGRVMSEFGNLGQSICVVEKPR